MHYAYTTTNKRTKIVQKQKKMVRELAGPVTNVNYGQSSSKLSKGGNPILRSLFLGMAEALEIAKKGL